MFNCIVGATKFIFPAVVLPVKVIVFVVAFNAVVGVKFIVPANSDNVPSP